MSATYGITIDRDGIWAGSGWVDHDGKIRDCPAALGPDQDASDETYEAIEDAIEEIAEGRDPEDPNRFVGSGSVERPDGIYSWSVSL